MNNRHFEPTDRFMYCPARFIDRDTTTGLQQVQWREEIRDYESFSPVRHQFCCNNNTINVLVFTFNIYIVADQYFHFARMSYT